MSLEDAAPTQEELEETREELARAEARISELEDEVTELENQVTTAQDERDEAKDLASDMEQSAIHFENLADERQSTIDDLIERVDDLESDIVSLNHTNQELEVAKEDADRRAEEYEDANVTEVRADAWSDAWVHITHLLGAFLDILELVRVEDGMRALNHPALKETVDRRGLLTQELTEIIDKDWARPSTKVEVVLKQANRHRMRMLVWNTERNMFRGRNEALDHWNEVRSAAGLPPLTRNDWEELEFLGQSFGAARKIYMEQESLTPDEPISMTPPPDHNPHPEARKVDTAPIPDVNIPSIINNHLINDQAV